MVCKTEIKNKRSLLEALSLLGVPKEDIRVAKGKEWLTLISYGSQPDKLAEILVTKDKFGGYGDFGFFKENNKTYDILIDDLDDRGALARKWSEGRSFSNSVKQWYAAVVAKKALKQQGFSTTIKQDGGRLRVTAQAA